MMLNKLIYSTKSPHQMTKSTKKSIKYMNIPLFLFKSRCMGKRSSRTMTPTKFLSKGSSPPTAFSKHGEEHVKKLFSTAVIVNEDTHSNLVRGHCFTGEDTNIFHPWSLKLEGFFRKSTNILFYMVTNLFIYTTGSSHIIDDCSRVVCFCQSLIGL